MNWRPIQSLYEPQEKIEKVFCKIDQKYSEPTHYAITELSVDYTRNTCSHCNNALKLSCGHIVVDDCDVSKMNGLTFASEGEWRRYILTKKMPKI